MAPSSPPPAVGSSSSSSSGRSSRPRPSSSGLPRPHKALDPSSSSSSAAEGDSLPVVVPKRRRLELNGLRFDSPGAAFDQEIDITSGRPSRRAASYSSAPAGDTSGRSSPLIRSSALQTSSSSRAPSPPSLPGQDHTASSSRLRPGSDTSSSAIPAVPPTDRTASSPPTVLSPRSGDESSRRQRRPSRKLREASEEQRRPGHTSPARSPPRRLPIKPTKGKAAHSSSSGREAGLASNLHKKRSAVNGISQDRERSGGDKEDRIGQIQKQLDDVHTDHDGLVRELFHLTKFVTYVGYDPEAVKDDRSHVFEHFRFQNGLNLEAQLASGPSARMTRRHVSRRMDDLSLRKASSPSQSKTEGISSASKGKGRASTLDEEVVGNLSSSQNRDVLKKSDAGSSASTLRGKGGKIMVANSLGTPTRTYKIQKHKASPLESGTGSSGRPPHQLFRNFHRQRDLPESAAEEEERALQDYWARSQPRRLPQITPTLMATHPSQVPLTAAFGGDIRAYFDSFRCLGEAGEAASAAEVRAFEKRDSASHVRIDRARREGRLSGEPYSLTALRPPRDAITARPKGIHDVMIEKICTHSASVKAEARHKRNLARKVSRIVQAYWSARTGDGEKARKAHERHLRSLAKWTVREVNKQWKLAVSVVKASKAKADKLERERQGREQLGRILEQSTKYLGAREEDLRKGRLESEEANDDDAVTDSDDSDPGSGASSVAGSESSLESDVYSLEDDGSDSAASIGADEDEGDEIASPDLESFGKDSNHLSALKGANGPASQSSAALRASSIDNGSDAPSEAEDTSSEHKVALLQQLLSNDDSDASVALEVQQSAFKDPIVKHSPNGTMRDHSPGPTRFTPAKASRTNGTSKKLITEIAVGNGSHHRDNSEASVESPPRPKSSSPENPDSPHQDPTEGGSHSPDFEVNGFASSVEDEDLELDDEMEEDGSISGTSEEDEGLMADADLPMEELMKRYGYASQAGEWQAEPVAEEEDSSPQDENLISADMTSRTSLVDAVDGKEETGEELVRGSPAPSKSQAKSPAGSSTSLQSSASVTRASSVAPSDDDVVSAVESQPRGLHPPFLLRGSLRPYQQTGFEWLASLYANKANGILADEMGLGKTIQTITLLAHLACDKGNWGPHLVIAPTSVMLNWEVEFKKFLPAFKILSYYGSQKERKEKRIGWNTEHQFNVCITSYQLVLADQHIFRRKPWVYMILDEAHHIKNFRSQRWQTLLGFNSERRLLLTGTPLQNNLMDLWSLMYFLMPNGLTGVAGAGAFANMKDFQEWFSNPLDRAVESGSSMDEETRKMVSKLHTVLRPFLLRRLKTEVEKELPQKYEHVLYCRLSKRQRFLYNDFMSRAKTRESLASGNYLSIINCLMQLRKVCNHPDLFEVRPINTAFAMERSVAADFEIKDLLVRRQLLAGLDLQSQSDALLHSAISFDVTGKEHLTPISTRVTRHLDASQKLPYAKIATPAKPSFDFWTIEGYRRTLEQRRHADEVADWKHKAYINGLRTRQHPVYGATLLSKLQQLGHSASLRPLGVVENDRRSFWSRCDNVSRLIVSTQERAETMVDAVDRFAMVPPKALARDLPRLALPGVTWDKMPEEALSQRFTSTSHRAATKLQIAFPDAALLQYDCGKLQELDLLMRRLKAGGHRILIFTQMTKVLDILEAFLNLHGYRYLRLDGSTRIDRRQALTEKFNRDPRIDAFILSTRSGGLGINLTGADTVLFYDLDWNSAIEAQCMDRAHRIGQTRDVHIYRFVSKATIEENMLRKADMKRRLDSVVIQGGEFTTEHLKRGDWRDMLDDDGTTLAGVKVGDAEEGASSDQRAASIPDERLLAEAEDEEDRVAAQNARQEMVLEDDTVTDFVREDVETADGGRVPEAAPGTPIEGMDPVVEEDGEEDDGGTVDDYMLRFVERDWGFFGGGGFRV
ncbi:hypothetical protein BCV69DRAFT_312487 [Microstroma glucosiphilum]|uniref:Helicase SWR1 n=1 Tax=Pseudomicrostroma glucosiphilum TaxID=1684307 RepID=A0A316U5M2_9BASI|nr:hypothetical protein BCV69DRAFT_312487 [Pseudomicrostroma glucosiphilum]PWN20529.1 hypothetical protein BCV69DRAFT_312487 [Pseudomicrostroma glucosiphilum]